MLYKIPPQITEAEKKKVATTTKSTGTALNSVGTTNFLISLLMQGSLQQLFGMLRALQLIVFTGLI
jgi:hypothetical protein